MAKPNRLFVLTVEFRDGKSMTLDVLGTSFSHVSHMFMEYTQPGGVSGGVRMEDIKTYLVVPKEDEEKH